VIAATHRDLGAAVERGTFREDLYYRLGDLAFELPPLRARREDIPLLAEQIRVDTNAKRGTAIEGITREALALMEGLPWHGNVRELETVVRRAMVLKGEGWVTPQDLHFGPIRFVEVAAADSRSLGAREARAPVELSWPQREALSLAAERQEVRRADLVARCGISREGARRELAGLVRAGLLKRMGAGRGIRYAPGPSVPGPESRVSRLPRGAPASAVPDGHAAR
jgi:DNA-binding NtrC family response regulator